MRNAQIERLRDLKKRMNGIWHTEMDAEDVLLKVEELVDILLMEVEDHDTAGSEP
jgi:hypothetical protein